MAHRADSDWPDDGALVAYLDGALEPDEKMAIEERLAADDVVRARLETLERGGRPFAEAYETLLAAAPRDRLQTILDSAAHAARQSSPPSARTSPHLGAIAAAIVVFLAGIALGILLPTFERATRVAVEQAAVGPQAPNWRQVVAEYQTLTTAESLDIIPRDVAVISEELTAVGDKLALSLTEDKLALPHVYLKDVQLLEFRGMPLAKLSYLSRDLGPIAFCIIANGREDAGFGYEEREGSNIVYWTKGGRGYMLIGKAPREDLETFAADLASRVA